MAIGLNDLKQKPKKNNSSPIDMLKEQSRQPAKSLQELSAELKNELDSFEVTHSNTETVEHVKEKKFSDIKRPWESFTAAEIATNLKAEKAVKKAQIIKQRNEKLAKELRERSDLFMRNPERFFNS